MRFQALEFAHNLFWFFFILAGTEHSVSIVVLKIVFSFELCATGFDMI